MYCLGSIFFSKLGTRVRILEIDGIGSRPSIEPNSGSKKIFRTSYVKIISFDGDLEYKYFYLGKPQKESYFFSGPATKKGVGGKAGPLMLKLEEMPEKKCSHQTREGGG